MSIIKWRFFVESEGQIAKICRAPARKGTKFTGCASPGKEETNDNVFPSRKRRRPLRRHLLCAVACGTGLALLCGCSAEPADSRGSEPGAADEAGRTEASSVTRDTDGTETSGPSQAVISRAPYMPSWAEMVTARLRETYTHSAIRKINRASAGTGTHWGKTAAAE